LSVNVVNNVPPLAAAVATSDNAATALMAGAQTLVAVICTT
jgi:hypothetical protein